MQKEEQKNNFVYNNIIGLTIPNTLTPAQTIYGHGIVMQIGSVGSVFPSGNTIGGVGTNMPNLISGNQQDGILLHNTASVTATTANSIIGNLIGTNATGTTAVANANNGIEIVNVNNTIMSSNVISGNTQNGISLDNSDGNTIQANIIGAQAPPNSTLALPNGQNGINIVNGSSSNIIGAVAAVGSNALANTIAFNTLNGVNISGATSDLNAVNHNVFSCNVLRGIELNATGNANYAKPVITGSPASITVTGPASSFIELYTTDGCATCPTNGTKLQGKVMVASGASPLTFTPVAGTLYTALAHSGSTTAAHNTSEFSACYTLCTNPTSVTVNTPAAFCQGTSATLTATVNGGTAPFTYVWKQGATTVGTNSSTLSVSTAGSYTVDVTSPTSCSTITSTAVTVTVKPLPVITNANPAAICSGATTAITLTSTPAATAYSWTLGTVTGVAGAAAGSGTSIAQTLTGSGTVDYIITGTLASCPSAPKTITVTVNPTPAVTNANPSPICSGATTAITLTSTPAATSYSWTLGTVTGVSGAAAGSGASIAQTLTGSGTVQYVITGTTGTCPSPTKTITVTVNPTPAVTNADPAAICSGATTAITLTSTPAATSYSWTLGTISGVSGAAAGSGTSIAQTLTGSGTVDYIITGTLERVRVHQKPLR